MQLINLLKNFGLTEAESRVYTTLLKIIEGTVYQIAKESEIPRPSVYLILESLKKQGLVIPFKKNNVLHYTAENPNQLSKILKKKEEILNTLLPELQNLTQTNQFKPVVKLYEGKEGLKTVFDDILETAKKEKIKQLCGITNPAVFDELPKYIAGWIERRVKLGINTKLIGPESYQDQPQAQTNQRKLREFRYLPDKYGYKYAIYFYAKKIALLSLKENEINSLIIESPALVEMFSALFSFTWDQLGEEK